MKRKAYKPLLRLSVLGILLNVALVWMTKNFGIPLYLDSVGTVIVAGLGGVLPGITVGFFSNCITAMVSVSPDPMTLYYAFLSVLLAVSAAALSRRGLLLKWRGRLLALLIFSAIGGALGSVVTWTLYGFSFGGGISAPLARFLYRHAIGGKFAAEFAADMGIDLLDKAITILIACAVFRLLPDAVLAKLPLGSLYEKSADAVRRPARPELRPNWPTYRKHSIRTKITSLIVISTSVLSVLAVTIGVVTYRSKLIAQDSRICQGAVQLMCSRINADRVEDFLAQGEQADGYTQTEEALRDILSSSPDIKYMYVYDVQSDGCHVVFDLDTAALPGEPVGTVVAFDDSFPYIDELLAGREIPPVITDDTYGWLLTVYQPIVNSSGRTVAYAAADIDMQAIRTSVYTFLIAIASLLFGVLLLIAIISLWYCDRNLLEPMAVLAEQAREFDFEGTRGDQRVRDRHTVETGDELEEVFHAMCRTEDAIAERVGESGRKTARSRRCSATLFSRWPIWLKTATATQEAISGARRIMCG